jgi:hypothetical protein
VADDNRDAAQSMSMLLKILGVESRVAHNGVDALEAMADSGRRLCYWTSACRAWTVMRWHSGFGSSASSMALPSCRILLAPAEAS